MEKKLFEDYYFLICDKTLLGHIISYFSYKNDYISKNIIQPDEEAYFTCRYIYDNYNDILEIFFVKLILNEEFDIKWKSFINIVKLQNKLLLDKNININLFTKYNPQQIFNKNKLNTFVIDFIKNNFILFQNNKNITNSPDLWIYANKYIPNKFFHKNLKLFEFYYSIKDYFNKNDIKDIIDSSYIIEPQINLLTKLINYKKELNDRNILQKDFIQNHLDYFSKTYELKHNINNKIKILEKAIDEKIQSHEPISILDLADNIYKKKQLDKELINKNNTVQNNLLFLINKK